MPQVGEQRTIRKLVFFYPDYRATSQHGAYGEGFEAPPEQVKKVGKSYFIGEVEVADKWLWKSDVTITEEYVPVLNDKKQPTGVCVWKKV